LSTISPTKRTVKIATYGRRSKDRRRQKHVGTVAAAIFGGRSRTARSIGQSRNLTLSRPAARGLRGTHAISFALEGDYVRTAFFNQSKKDFQIDGRIVSTSKTGAAEMTGPPSKAPSDLLSFSIALGYQILQAARAPSTACFCQTERLGQNSPYSKAVRCRGTWQRVAGWCWP